MFVCYWKPEYISNLYPDNVELNAPFKMRQ